MNILENDEPLGHLGDISENGLMLIVEKPFPYSKFKKITIQLSDFDFSRDSIELEVEIRWMRPDKNPKLQLIGCKFVNLKAEELPIIKEIQDFLGFND